VEPSDVAEAKRSVRGTMRALRRGLPDQGERSQRLCRCLIGLPAIRDAHTVMVFEPVPGEPDLATFVAWCRAEGKAIVAPDPWPSAPLPADPATIDVVLVPGMAFTPGGSRLGQGGGWYDCFLAQRRSDAMAVGVCFEPQLVDELPVEDHDVVVDLVVTDVGIATGVTERTTPEQ
jgi:5-formyltetrahydrofolate cyclo-ligase